VIISEGHPATKRWFFPSTYATENATRRGYRRAYNTLLADKVAGVYYLEGDLKFGGDIETDPEAQAGAVCGVHPSDYGFWHMAKLEAATVNGVLNGTIVDARRRPMSLPVSTSTNLGSGIASVSTSGSSSTSSGSGSSSGTTECKHWSAPVAGYIADHQIGQPTHGGSLGDCQQLCNSHSACESVDFDSSRHWCNLRDCSVGDGVCAVHASTEFHSFTCVERKGQNNTVVWTSGEKLGVGGKGWDASENPGHYWRRFPDRAEASLAKAGVKYVWDLSMATSSIVVGFEGSDH
jgi:hypothetical protein